MYEGMSQDKLMNTASFVLQVTISILSDDILPAIYRRGAINGQWGLMEINNRPFNLMEINGDKWRSMRINWDKWGLINHH